MANNPDKTTGKPNSTKKEFLIFISIPISIIIIVAAAVMTPGLFAKPKYDFVYSYCPTYQCANSYYVNGIGSIVSTPNATNSTLYNYQQPEIYYYSESNNSSRRIEFLEAKAYKLDSENISPDGYKLEQSNGSDAGFLFWGSGDYNWYLKNGVKKKRVNLANQDIYTNNIRFLGWVQK